MVISISASLLSSYYDARAGVGASATSSGSTTPTVATPTPPWQSTSTAPKQSALVDAALKGASFFNPATTKLTVPGGAETSDYKNLFALYQGVNALQGLATDAGAATLTTSQQAAYSAAFTKGMTQLQTFLSQTSFKGLDLAEGTLTASDQTTEGAPQESDTYTTGTVFSGTSADAVPAFQGDVTFAATLTSTKGAVKTVNFDLSQMGSTPRTMGNVVNYLNAQLTAAGAATKFKVISTPAPPETTTVNGKTVTLSTPPNNFSMEVVGTPLEKLAFVPPSSAPAVYITAASGTAAVAASGKTAAVPGDQTQQLLKFNTAAAGQAQAQKTTLQSAVQSALASATGPDGSLYVLSNIDGTTADGQTINGAQDVALMKYDSAGNVVYTRTLGAANSASGYAIAVSGDGSKVAVAGSVTGALDGPDKGQTATSTNSFVTLFNATGDEQWTSTQASTAGDVATGVAFGADGSVYATGSTQGRLPNSGGEIGGQDGYLRGYSAATGKIAFTTQFGTSGKDAPAGIAVSGSSIYVAGTENGDAVVRQFNIQTSGAPTAGTVRDLGALQGGNVVWVGVNKDGSVVVAGSTHNGALSAGAVTNSYQSGREGFIASLNANLKPTSSDALTYVATTGDLTASAMTIANGQVYLAGQVATTPPANSGFKNTVDGYVAAVDPTKGSVTWSQQFQGTDDKAAPTSVAVSTTGASVLDLFGLPATVSYAKSPYIVANTSVRAGDSFYVQSGSGPAKQIVIQSTDTLKTLATEIARASGYTATVTNLTVNGENQMKIVPANASTAVKLIAGPTGGDALAGLGLNAGEISSDVGAKSTVTRKAKVTLGLNLSTALNLNSATSIKQAQSAFALASAKIQNAYQALVNPNGSSTVAKTSTSTANLTYINARTADYQRAVERLSATTS